MRHLLSHLNDWETIGVDMCLRHLTGVVAGEADKLVEGVLDLLDPGKKEVSQIVGDHDNGA